MKLYHLYRLSQGYRRYDEAYAFVIRAKSESHARLLAAQKAGDEGEASWLDSRGSNCEELRPEGAAKVIVRDFLNG